jgi:hypothetical protein
MSASLDQLKATGTVVVSDSGDFESEYLIFVPSNYRPLITYYTDIRHPGIDAYKPQDATTNPVCPICRNAIESLLRGPVPYLSSCEQATVSKTY